MRVVSLTVCISALTAAVAARAIPETHVLHERRDESSSTRVEKGVRVAADSTLSMRVGLTQRNLDKAEQWLMEVSSPESKKYGQHWSADKIVEAFRPSQESVDLVTAWLHMSGIDKARISHSDNKQWLAVDVTADEAERLLHADYHEYEHEAGHTLIGTDEYHIPKHLQSHIDYITPGVKRSVVSKRDSHTRYGRPGPQSRAMATVPKSANDLSTCDKTITPACIRALYDFDVQDPHAKVSPDNHLGIFEEGDFYAQGDLNAFFANFTSNVPNGTHPILDSIDGGQAPVPQYDAGGESDLDFEIAIPIVYPQKTIVYQTDDSYYSSGGSPSQDGLFNTFLDALDGSYCTYSAYGETGDSSIDPSYPDPNGYDKKLMCGVYKPANVISISYGLQEDDLPASYQKRQCNEFLKLGMQGSSIFVASGDTGVAGTPGDGSENGCLNNGTVFNPTFPNNCPWLTNVGATSVQPGQTVHDPESAVYDVAGNPFYSAFFSSGGFSNIYPIPKYQQKAVETYFKDHNPPYPYYHNGDYANSNGLYNRNGRGIPDVAANGNNIATVNAGAFQISGGTSASSPLFASVVNRIVEERIKAGKGPIGFINPALYENPWILNDIVNGTNPGCGTDGFSCAPGWDPVTGLGTPSYPKMLKFFLSLP